MESPGFFFFFFFFFSDKVYEPWRIHYTTCQHQQNLLFLGKHLELAGSIWTHAENEFEFHGLHKNFSNSKITATRLWLAKAKVTIFLFIYTKQEDQQFENLIIFLVLLIIQNVNVIMDLFPSGRKPSFKNLSFMSNWGTYEKICKLCDFKPLTIFRKKLHHGCSGGF